MVRPRLKRIEHQRHRQRDPERGAQDRAATVPRQPDRDREQHEQDERQVVRDVVEELDPALRLPQILGVDEHDLAVEPGRVDVVEQADPGVAQRRRDLVDHRAEVHDDLAVLGGDAVGSLALEHVDDLRCARRRFDLPPERLELVGLDDPQRRRVHHLLGATDDDRREPLRPRGKQVGDLGLEIGVLDQGVRDPGGDGLLDRGVARERRHRVDVLVACAGPCCGPRRRARRSARARRPARPARRRGCAASAAAASGRLLPRRAAESGVVSDSFARLDHRSPPCATQCSARSPVESAECNAAASADPGDAACIRTRSRPSCSRGPGGAATASR